jgi:predicted RNase H-like HicB family nuclease
MNETAYTIIIERAGDNYSAYCPDVPGCAAVGDTPDETMDNFRDAMEFHFEGLQLHGYPIPQPSAEARQLELAAR